MDIFKDRQKTSSFYAKPRLSINELSLLVYLGCSSEERSVPQEVSFSIEVEYPKPPLGEVTDHLEEDTPCYNEICNLLKDYVKDKKFNLIEKMARESFVCFVQKVSFCFYSAHSL